LRLLIVIMIIITTSCTEIFKTELPPIEDCTGSNDICSYSESIQPIFDMYCTKCHGSQGGLDLSSYLGLMAGGQNGEIIDDINFSNSLLLLRITDQNNPMPPEYEDDRLDETYIIMIEKWIKAGGKNN
jgi:hypothetical protein